MSSGETGFCELSVKKIVVTTVPGLEDLLEEEISKFLPGVGVIRKGRVIYESFSSLGAEDLFRLVAGLTLGEKVYAILSEAPARSLDDVRDAALSALGEIKLLLGPETCFAVDAEREGEHPFSSVDIARVVGSVVQTIEPPPPVSLDDPDVVLHAELVGDEFRLAIDLTPFLNLRDRGYRVYIHPSSLNPVVARALCKLAGVEEGCTFVDPMCGSGTIVIEGLLEAPGAQGFGFDVKLEHVVGARANAKAAGVDASFGVADVRTLPSMLRRGVDAIVTNPPYGIRERAAGGLRKVYESLLRGAHSVLEEGGRLVLISPLKRFVERAASSLKWLPSSVRKLDMGGLTTFVYVFVKADSTQRVESTCAERGAS
jgi:23S rRNA G2445 N2-methylase RlmL